MQGHHYQKLVLWCGMLGLMGLLLGGCRNQDPCQDLSCGHGVCVDGQCLCEATYEGLHCDTLCSEKFIGSDWVNDVQCQGSATFFSSQVKAAPQGQGYLTIYHVLAVGDSLQALAHQDTLLVEEQIYGTGYVQGKGLYSPTAFTLELVLEDAMGLETNCVAVFRR